MGIETLGTILNKAENRAFNEWQLKEKMLDEKSNNYHIAFLVIHFLGESVFKYKQKQGED